MGVLYKIVLNARTPKTPEPKKSGVFYLQCEVNRERGPGGALKTCRERGRIPGWEASGDNASGKMGSYLYAVFSNKFSPTFPP